MPRELLTIFTKIRVAEDKDQTKGQMTQIMDQSVRCPRSNYLSVIRKAKLFMSRRFSGFSADLNLSFLSDFGNVYKSHSFFWHSMLERRR